MPRSKKQDHTQFAIMGPDKYLINQIMYRGN